MTGRPGFVLDSFALLAFFRDEPAAALAQRLSAAVVTGDPDFRQVEDLVRI